MLVFHPPYINSDHALLSFRFFIIHTHSQTEIIFHHIKTFTQNFLHAISKTIPIPFNTSILFRNITKMPFIRLAALAGTALLSRWHKMLALPRQSPASWQSDRLREVIQECAEAKTYIERLSENSDVFFCISRARHEGHNIAPLPSCNTPRNALVYAYMIGKFSLRWGFHRTAARLSGVKGVCEVTNPGKDHKIQIVAQRHGIDPGVYGRVATRLRWVFPLLP